MRIVICDDDIVWCEQAERLVAEYGARRQLALQTQSFLSGREMLERVEKAPEVLLLDIRLEREDGIAVAAQVNQRWKDCQIVYLTDYLQYATEVYHTAHVFYVLKEQFAQRIDEVFEKIFHELAQREKALIFSMNRGKELVLYPREIFYFERNRRVTEVVTEHGAYQIKPSIHEIVELLPEKDFVRCHNSYVVYFPAVLETRKHELVMKNGKAVPISRSYAAKTRGKFLSWAMTQIS